LLSFLAGKMSFHALGIGMGIKFEQGSHCDDEICALGQEDLVIFWAGKRE
jgi:hypothetical protein